MASPAQGVLSALPDSQQEQQRSRKLPSKQHAQKGPAEGEDNTNRKLLNLPPIVGSCMQYANKSVRYRPFPADVDDVRTKMFLMEKALLFDSQQIADYWPHVSNLYMRSSKPMARDNGTVSEAWECRIRRRVTMKGKDKTGAGIRQRQSKDELLGDVNECKFRLNLLSYTKHVTSQEACGGPGFGNCHCLAEWLYIEPTNNTAEYKLQHTHSLDLLDMYKRSDALMYFCKLKVEEGQYSYAAVVRWAQEKYGPVSSQLQRLSKADVANAARPWRKQNKDVELRTVIVEETNQHKQYKECFDSIQNTSAEQLRKALRAVCKAYPDAVEVIAPFIEKLPDDQYQANPIIEGHDINLPPPGRARKRKLTCDPPSPLALPDWPPGPNQPVTAQSIQTPLLYSHSYPQTSPPVSNNTLRGVRTTLPTPTTQAVPSALNAAHQAITNGIPSSSAPPRPPYPVAILHPMNILQDPRPSMAQSSAARIVPQTTSSQQIPTTGNPRV